MMCQKQFERAPCLLCIKFVKWLPVLFILAATVWSYYAYVVQLCILTVENDFTRALYLILYHIFFSVFLWSYWQTIFSEIAVVPKRFKLSPSDVDKLETAETEDAQKRFLESFARDLPVFCRNMSGGLRYCEKCQHIKPDRAHHCSVCGVCVLKMDHHCPWVNNCVAFHNYKFFILFLNYALLYCLYVALTVLPYFIQFFTHDLTGLGKFHILFLFFVAVMFAISLVSLFGYHCYLVALNRSTLESFRAPVFSSGPDKNGFYLGKYNNFQEVFGDNKKKWFLPVFSSLGDGVFYPTSHRLPNNIVSYNTMASTIASPTSLGDGINYPQRLIDEDTDQLIGGRQRWTESGDNETVFAAPFQTPTANGNLEKNNQESHFAKQINGMV